jgi:hypothetical protein
MINGSRDPNSDSVWSSFVTGLNKYSVDQVTSLYQAAYDSIK